jgi:D-mannonate dehydratase
VNPNAVQAQPMLLVASASLNLIDNENKEKYNAFAIRKTKVPPKTMQRIQISQMIEPVGDKSEIWFAIPSDGIPENLLCEEQIISYEKREGFIWITNNHENNTITIKKGTCLGKIQVISENDLDRWENS